MTFGLLYAWSENFILPLSHDEVVHMKGSLLNKMPGTNEQKFANLRALYAYMWAHPGKKLLFMGGEIGQWREWTETESLDWHLVDDPLHRGVQNLVRDLNRIYDEENALWEMDSDPAGFEWLDVDNALDNIVAFLRRSPTTGRELICVGNFSAVPRPSYRLALPNESKYQRVVDTDAKTFAGNGGLSISMLSTEDVPLHGRPHSALIDLQPLSTLWFTSSAKCR